MLGIQFIFCAALIVFAGTRLTRYADILSDRLNLGKVWIGVALLGLVTSLPEAFTSLAAVVWVRSNDLAVGDIFGSNNFNPTLIVVMDLLYRQGSVTDRIHYQKAHLIPAAFAMLLTLVAVVEMTGLVLPVSLGFSRVGMGSLLLLFLYFWGMRLLSRSEIPVSRGSGDRTPQPPLGPVYGKIAVSAVAVVLGAIWLVHTADSIAKVTGLGQTFVGVLFLGLVTSLPEMVVSISAMRMRALDMAIGNIFGSNMMNLAFIFVCDLFYVRGPILAGVARTNLVPALSSLLMVAVALAGIRAKNKRTLAGMGWDSYLLALIFVVTTTLLYHLR